MFQISKFNKTGNRNIRVRKPGWIGFCKTTLENLSCALRYYIIASTDRIWDLFWFSSTKKLYIIYRKSKNIYHHQFWMLFTFRCSTAAVCLLFSPLPVSQLNTIFNVYKLSKHLFQYIKKAYCTYHQARRTYR